MTRKTKNNGFSLVEVIIVAALASLVFGALFTAFHASLELVRDSRAKLSALSLANERMEYFRSLPYDNVGTIAGIPPGLIPQNSTTTLNGITFMEKVLVEYVDDPADGQDTATTSDDNAISADYKRIKVEYTWGIDNSTSSIMLVSNIVPRSIETTGGGGTVKINVLDADSALLPGAPVRLINNTTIPNIDVTRISNASGVALFSGAPTSSDYEVIVTGPIAGQSYSTAGTYQATPSNPNPSVAPFAVLEADVSTLTFQIGQLSDLEIRTFSDITDDYVVEEFSDLSGVASSSNVEAVSGELVLSNTAGVYATEGFAHLTAVSPATISNWGAIRMAYDNPVDTNSTVQLFTGVTPGPYTLIPDGDLNGNATGFTQSLIDISALDPVAYPSIVVGVGLTTSDTGETSAVEEIGVYYHEGEVALPNTSLNITGKKIIGTELDTTPIYKYDQTEVTDGSGELELTDMEFDIYTITPTGAYDIATACGAHPIDHQAGIDSLTDLELVTDRSDTLRAIVTDSWGEPLPGVQVNLSRSGYDVTEVTNLCGQAFFSSGVTNNADYVLDVSATGYVSQNTDPFTVSGDTVTEITLSE